MEQQQTVSAVRDISGHTQWLDCNEFKPEMEKKYLLWMPKKNKIVIGKVMTSYATQIISWRLDDGNMILKEDVTHYRLLPSPPIAH